MVDIPVEILEEILALIPVKSLMRFRSVSKLWCSLIDSRDFAKMHFKKAQGSVFFHKLIFQTSNSGPIFSIDVDSFDHAHPLKPPFVPSEFSNSCNGLILLVDDNNSLVIWNPFTRKYKALPPHHVGPPKNTPAPFFVTTVTNTKFGFGYDSLNDDYKVLMSMTWVFRTYQMGAFDRVAKVYSLKSNTWKNTIHSPSGYGKWVVYVNGAFHSLLPNQWYITGFDLATEECNRIPLPEGLQVDDVFNMTVIALQGFLCLHYERKTEHDISIDIWIMKEYGVKESWTKLLSLAISTYDGPLPITFSISGQKVLLNINNTFVWFDLKCDAFNEGGGIGSLDGNLLKRKEEVGVQALKRKRAVDGVQALSVFHAEFCVETIHSPDHYCERPPSRSPPLHTLIMEKQTVKNLENSESFEAGAKLPVDNEASSIVTVKGVTSYWRD